MELILAGTRDLGMERGRLAPPENFDFDADGILEIPSLNSASLRQDTLRVVTLGGDLVWELVVDADDICVNCENWRWEFEAFGDVDPELGREAILSWNAWLGTDIWGTVVYSTASGMILDQFFRRTAFVYDIDANGTDELCLSEGGGSFEIWGHSAPSGFGRWEGEDPAVQAISFCQRPSPGRGVIQIAFKAFRPTDGTIRIHDVSGRQVRDLGHYNFAGGPGKVVWDGHDDSGSPAGAGIYYLHFDGSSEIDATRLILLK
jgi:hypothetical protein